MKILYGSDIKVELSISEPEDNYHAIFEAKTISKKAGFKEVDQTLIATVVSELSTNIIRYAVKGNIELEVISTSNKIGIKITATDKGPGIKNIEKAMKDNYTTTKDSLGMGLSSIKRIMDEFIINSEVGIGTTIVAYKWKKETTDGLLF